MTQDSDPSKGKRPDKEAALAAALRANLRRRKAGEAKPAPAKPAKARNDKGP